MSTTRSRTHPNFREVMAPHPFTKGKNGIVFLSGAIDSFPVSWQRTMTAALSHLDVIILNPIREDWDSEWKEDLSFKPWVEQTKWELDGLEAADVIAIYFAPRSPQARTLMELGLWARSSKCVVGCSEGYPKKAEVRLICDKYGIEYVTSIEELVAAVKRKLDAQISHSARGDTAKELQETKSMMNSIQKSKEHPSLRETNIRNLTGNTSEKRENTIINTYNIFQRSEDTGSAQGPENFPSQRRSIYSSQASTVFGTLSRRGNTINQFANQDSILLTEIKGREEERLQRGQRSLDLEAGNFSLEAPGDAAQHGSHDGSGASSIFVLDNDPTAEKKWKPGVLAGYPMSASFIVLDKDRGTALFKRFDEPSMRNLLYLQSRVACLAAKQEKFDKEDFASDNESITRRLNGLELRLQARLDEVPDPPATFIFGGYHQEWRRRVASAIDGMNKYKEPIALFHTRLDDLEGCISSRIQSPTNSMRENLDLLACNIEIFERSKGKDREREHNIDIYPRLDVRRDLPFRRRLGNLIFYIARILDVLPGPLLLDLLNYVFADAATQPAIASLTLEDILSQPLDDRRPDLDPPSLLTEIDHILTSLEVIFQDALKEYLRDKLVPDAPYFAAKSWEDFEMFSRSYELMPKRQQEWEEEHPDKPWPFAKMSEKWVEKMEERWELAMEMKQALKEYHEALLLQENLFKLAKPAERTRKVVWKWYLTSYSNIEQFWGNSLVDLVGEDIVALRTAGEEDTVSKILSRYFAYFFLDKGISTRRVQFTSEKRISRVVTGVNMGAAIVSLVAAVWVLSKVNDYKIDKSVKVSKQELGWLTGFIVGFALWVGFMTRLPRKDVFGAIAVYAAVLVVFVGTGA